MMKEDLLDKHGNQIVLSDKVQNLFYYSHEFNVTGYVSPQPYFFKDKKTRKYKVNDNKSKVFSVNGLTYDNEEQNNVAFNITFPITEKFIDRNASLYLHVEYEADYRFKKEHIDLEEQEYRSMKGYSNAWFKNNGTTIVMHRSIQLIKFSPKIDKEKTVSLLGGDVTEIETPVKEEEDDEAGVKEEEDKPKEYLQHIKPEIY